jgi:hypothetical protein
MVRIIVEGHDLPGARFFSDGALLENVHAAVQVGKDPVDPIRADADSVRWDRASAEFVVMRPLSWGVCPGHGVARVL